MAANVLSETGSISGANCCLQNGGARRVVLTASATAGQGFEEMREVSVWPEWKKP